MSIELTHTGYGPHRGASAASGGAGVIVLAIVLAAVFFAALATKTHIRQCQALETTLQAVSACLTPL